MILWSAVAAATCASFDAPRELNPIRVTGLGESSGLASSLLEPGVLWTHNDDGPATLFRIGQDGVGVALDLVGADNQDWEDLAAAPCGRHPACVYVGDIGADRDVPDELQVYVARERDGGRALRLVERWELRWPGEPRDAETLLVHPCSTRAWIVTRGLRTEVFRVPDERGPRPLPLVWVASLNTPDITAGDFSPDGSQVALRSSEQVWIWSVDPDDPEAHWATEPSLVATELPDAEGLTWNADGDLLTSSEGVPARVLQLACAQPEPEQACTEQPPRGCDVAAAPLGGGTLVLTLLLGRPRRRVSAPRVRPTRP